MTDPAGAGHSCAVPLVSRSEAVAHAAPRPDPPGAEAPPPDFESLYEECFPLVWRSLRRLGVPLASLEDATQDVFLAVHRRLPGFEGRSSVRTWVFGFVLRVARDHRRRSARKGGVEPLSAELADRSASPLDRLERSEALELLDSLLATLDEDRRAVFVMSEIEQMTAPEIAEVVGLSINTVYSKLRLARRDLDREIERRRGDER